MTEKEWDKKLKIDTCGRVDGHADEYHHPYEPTPYCVLERLAESEYIHKDSKVLDYGCGKGRVGFFLHYKLGCSVMGIEYDEKICAKAKENRESYVGGATGNVAFVCRDAKDFPVENADCFYFFNPFSLEILQSVLGRILESYYEEPRSMQLFFYYPADEYVAYLMTKDELLFVDEIDCGDLFPGENMRERILIFEVV
jgi:SAM-dependent methyltransferase